jgi:hypothetical protein
MQTTDGVPAQVRRRLALHLAGWHYAEGWWRRGRGEALHERLVDVLPPEWFQIAVGWSIRVMEN